MAAPKAPLLDTSGKKAKDVTLEQAIFAADVKAHLVHETVRAELNARRAGTRAAKSRGLVSGGRAKPWRQKGTGRARAGTIRAPQFTGGGVVFPPTPRSFEVKVNRKARHAALRGALTQHAARGTLAVIPDDLFDVPSTRQAAELVAAWGKDTPMLVVAEADQDRIAKSFRNLDRTVVTLPSTLDVATVVWARSLIVTESALELVQRRASIAPPKGSASIAPPKGSASIAPPKGSAER